MSFSLPRLNRFSRILLISNSPLSLSKPISTMLWKNKWRANPTVRSVPPRETTSTNFSARKLVVFYNLNPSMLCLSSSTWNWLLNTNTSLTLLRMNLKSSLRSKNLSKTTSRTPTISPHRPSNKEDSELNLLPSRIISYKNISWEDSRSN